MDQPRESRTLAEGRVVLYNPETGEGKLRMDGADELVLFSDEQYRYPAEGANGGIVAVEDTRARMEPDIGNELMFGWMRRPEGLVLIYWFLKSEYREVLTTLRTGCTYRIFESVKGRSRRSRGREIWKGKTLDGFLAMFPYLERAEDFDWEVGHDGGRKIRRLELRSSGGAWSEVPRSHLIDGTMPYFGVRDDELTAEATAEIAR